ncbi:hypothetical protein R3P38DRAFT_2584146, partial [Favolaschia claudopus]
VLISLLTFTVILLMGRSAKYLTSLQRTSANRESTSKYSTSPQCVRSTLKIIIPFTNGCSGRATRTASKQRSRQRKGPKLSSAHPEPLSATLNLLPGTNPPTERMLQLHNQPLPLESSLFTQALRSPEALDESDLGRWKAEPPFEEDADTTDPRSLGYFRFTKSLSEVLHGVRLREQRLRDTSLKDEVARKGLEAVFCSIQAEVRELLLCWDRVEKLIGAELYHPFHQSREFAMLEHYFQWLARSICHLYFLEFLQ